MTSDDGTVKGEGKMRGKGKTAPSTKENGDEKRVMHNLELDSGQEVVRFRRRWWQLW
jgi:hypothetical protein